MVTHESLKEWLAAQGHPLEVVEDPRTGMPIYVLQQRSDVAKMRYLGLLAIPPGRFMSSAAAWRSIIPGPVKPSSRSSTAS